jgi:hypothetical protein
VIRLKRFTAQERCDRAEAAELDHWLKILK